MPGRSTFTATSRPSSARRARWTCAMDAAATGSENALKTESTDSPNSASIVALAMAIGKGGSLSCR